MALFYPSILSGAVYALVLSLNAFAEEAAPVVPAPNADHAPSFAARDPATDENLKGYVINARDAASKQDWVAAEAAYHHIMDLAAPDSAKRQPMYDMGRMFESHQAYAKAAMVYEEFLDRFPDDPASADVAIRLGRADRELGAFPVALNKFYSALNNSLRSTSSQKIALQAQFEIAQTHFAMGNYADARRYFERLVLLDMSPDDHALVQFRLANTTFLAGDFGKAVALCKGFISDHPDATQVPETRYLLTRALQKLGRSDEASQETLALLKQNQSLSPKDVETRISWQKRTGTEVASELYDRGETMNALSIYQKLAELDTKPTWRLPIVYQIGLCFERLRMVGKAMEAYTYIVTNTTKAASDAVPATTETAAAAPAPGSGTDLQDMAKWRMDYLRWATDTDRQISSLVKPDWNTADIQPLQIPTSALAQPPTPTASR